MALRPPLSKSLPFLAMTGKVLSVFDLSIPDVRTLAKLLWHKDQLAEERSARHPLLGQTSLTQWKDGVDKRPERALA